jgi:signal transduction histidine kinase
MTLSRHPSHPWKNTALKVAVFYIIAAGLWIVCSDYLLASLSQSAGELSHWQTAKGWLFVLATGGLRFVYLNRCLRRQHEAFNELTTLLDSTPAVVYVADMQSYELLFVNSFASEQFGPQWQNRKCYDYLQQGQLQPCGFCTNQQLLRDGLPGPPISWEFRNTKNGRWYQCLDKAMHWPDGRLIRCEIALDISERKELDRTKEELLSAVSHEMRTPLTAIAGFSELLLDEPTLTEPARRHIQTIFRESEKMRELVQTFLEVRRLKTDQARIDYEPLTARTLLEYASSNDDCTSRHHLNVDCDQTLTVYGNRRELGQVFRQLAANACRFSPEGGEILLQGRAAGNFIEITVADHGIGIPAEEQERIFEPFHRLDIGDRRRVRGVGLGLTMVREIVALHGGTIRVDSTPGAGSRFVVTLPVPAPALAGDLKGPRDRPR